MYCNSGSLHKHDTVFPQGLCTYARENVDIYILSLFCNITFTIFCLREIDCRDGTEEEYPVTGYAVEI